MSSMNRLRGLRALLEDVVEHGTTAVERVHRATAARPFDVLDHIPPVAPAARGVRLIHDATVAGVYETIRQVNHLVGVTLAAAIDLYDPESPGPEGERAGAHPGATTDGEHHAPASGPEPERASAPGEPGEPRG
jgi:hypothetical protein